MDRDGPDLYAPTALVVAQQFWNAMQVVVVFLIVALNFQYSKASEEAKQRMAQQETTTPRQKSMFAATKWIVRVTSIVLICIMPFCIYVVSPGATIFAFLTATLTAIALMTPKSTLRVSLGEEPNEPAERNTAVPDNQNKTYWVLFPREETFGFLCTLGSSLYNLTANTKIWPYWKTHWLKVDEFMGWPTSGDLTVAGNYNMMGLFESARRDDGDVGNLSSVMLPFVPRTGFGTTMGAQVFFLVWAFLPILYASYFVLLMIMTQKTRSRVACWLQRFMCGFGICHMLFWTDVVAYAYGRGLVNPHQAVFHWTERWAWRFAIYVPIWQNCTSGHWYSGHRHFPIIGKLVHYFAKIWVILFFCFQTINADIFRTVEFVFGYKKASLITILGWDDANPLMRKLRYPYFRALVHMWCFYALLHVLGFKLYRIFVQRDDTLMPRRTRNNRIEEGGL